MVMIYYYRTEAK